MTKQFEDCRTTVERVEYMSAAATMMLGKSHRDQVVAEVRLLQEALLKCRDKFCEYERQHEAKARAANPGGSSRSMNGEAAERWAKAERNREMAEMCDAALAGQQAHE